LQKKNLDPEIITIESNKGNYSKHRDVSKIEYIVVHYTANDGDTAKGNANYYHNNKLGVSAHYFVDDNTVVQSVPDDYVANAVGGSKWNNEGGRLYKKAMNTNSLSIELADPQKLCNLSEICGPQKDCGDFKKVMSLGKEDCRASTETINNALTLVRQKMKEYGVDKDHVIRHYDVNGKPCPVYWTQDSRWKEEFWNKLE